MTDTLKYSRAAFLRTAARMALCAALCATITLFGCGKDAESAGAENGGMPDETTGEAEDMFRITDDYVIIIPEGSKADAKAANLLKKGLSDKGIVLKFIDDSYGVNEHEIILGPAARDDAKKTNIDPSAGVMPGGWEIRLAESGNLVVSGDTYAAARWLLDSCVGDDGFLVSDGLCESYTPEWELVFEDDFDGDELDETKWRRCPEWDRSDMGGRWDDGMIFLDGRGHLVDRADIVDGVPLTGAVRTCDTFMSTYGYYEICCTLHQAKGMWGAFWMMLGPNVGSGDGAEADIFESLYNEGNIYFTLHYDGYGDRHKSVSAVKRLPDAFDGSFHRFGLLWTKEGYRWYMDGEQVFSTDVAPVSQPGYMKISTECGSWGGKLDESELPSDMLVDWVRVWQVR